MHFRYASILVAGFLLSLSGCKKVCDTDDLPRYPLTAGLRAWAAPYPKDAVLRFRNASTGYVRSYRVSSAENKTDGVSSGANVCPSYYREYTAHVLERTDSTGGRENKLLRFDMTTANATRARASFTIGSTNVELLIQEVEDGQQATYPATFGTRTYTAVLGGTSSLAFQGASVVTTLYVTKAEGLVRFVERGGTTWDRL